MILVIDNYDSFVHNLSRYFRRLGQRTEVVRNDAIDASRVAALAPRAIVLSPGPCTPREAGCSVELVRRLSGSIPILGVCLGHQAIGVAFGGEICRSPRPIHGEVSAIVHHGEGLFAGLPSPLAAGRYHSLLVDAGRLPACLAATAWTEDGVLMAVQHVEHATFGVQFHPESVLTTDGQAMIANFLSRSGIAFNTPDPQLELRPAEAKRESKSIPLTPVAY